MKLRPYQQKMIDDIVDRINEGYRRILIVSATGSGKTHVFTELCRRTEKKGNRTMVMVHRDPLVGQTKDKLNKKGLYDIGYVKAGWESNPQAPVQVASLQTMSRRREWYNLNPDLMIADEAHETGFHNSFRRALELFPEAIVLGFTATPFRLSAKQGMGDVFEVIVQGPTTAELQDAQPENYLVPVRYFSLSKSDITRGVKTEKGDYAQRQLSVVCNQPEQVNLAVSEWAQKAERRRTLAFCVDVPHAGSVRDAFNQAGFRAGIVTGSECLDHQGRSYRERDDLYKMLAQHELDVITNCNVLTVGYDEPSVEVGLTLRPTKSEALWFQTLGRLLRLSPETGKTEAMVLDQAGNVLRLGKARDLTADRFTLKPGGKRSSSSSTTDKVCPLDDGGCGAVVSNFDRSCPECGHEFVVDEDRRFTSQTTDLEEILPDLDPRLFLKRQTYKALLAHCYRENWSPGSAVMRFNRQYHEYPDIKITKGALFPEPTPQNHVHYFNHLAEIAKTKGKDLEWLKRFMSAEFGSQWLLTITNPRELFRLAQGSEQMKLFRSA